MKAEIDSFVKHNHPRYTDITSPGKEITCFRADYIKSLQNRAFFSSDAFAKSLASHGEVGCLDAPSFLPTGSIENDYSFFFYTTLRE